MVRISSLLLLLLFGITAAADIKVELPPGDFQVNQSFTVRFLITEQSRRLPPPDLSVFDKDFSILNKSQSYSSQVINGKRASQHTLELELMPKRAGRLTLPTLQIGDLQSRAQPIQVKAATKQTAKQNGQDREFYIEATAEPRNPYVQQEVKYTFKIFMAKQLSGDISRLELDGNAVTKPLAQAKKYRLQKGGRSYQIYEQTYMVYPQESGKLAILPLQLKGYYVVNRRRYAVNREAPRINLNVRPIPAEFSGAHWLPAKNLELSQTWTDDFSEWHQGGAQTRVISLKGEGVLASQLPEIEVPKVDAFNVYANRRAEVLTQPAKQGFVGNRIQEFVMIPSEVGAYTLGEIKIPWWNTRADRMEYAVLPAIDVQIGEATAGTLVMEDSETLFEDEVALTQAYAPASATWIWLSVFFGFGWLATLAVMAYRYYRTYTRRGDVQRQQTESIRQCRKHVKQACLANDASAARAALLKWSKAKWGEYAPNALGQLAIRCSGDLGDELHLLEETLYGKTTAAWEGKLLWDIFANETAEVQTEKDTAPSNLESLHKLT